MNALSGYKTVIASAVGVLGSVLWMFGIQVDLEFQGAIVTAIMGCIGIALNFQRALDKWKARRNPHGPLGVK